jgi:hypothetical protein
MQWGIGWLYIDVGHPMVRGPNGHRSNCSEIEGRPDPRLETKVLDGVPDGRARRGCSDGGHDERLPNLRLQIMVPDGVPDGARQSARRGLTEYPTGPCGSHVIGHVIFECHVTRLGWQGVILLPTLLSQC